MHFPRAFLLLGMAMSASAMMSPHLASKLNHRRHGHAVARAIADDAAPVPPVAAIVTPRKRANTRRCKPKPSTSVAESAASTSQITEATPTPSAPANVGGDVPTSFSDAPVSSQAPEPSSSKAPEEPKTTAAAPVQSSSKAPEEPKTTAAAPVQSSSQAPEEPKTSKAPSSEAAPSTQAPATTQAATTKATPTKQSSAAAQPTSSGGNGGGLLTDTHTGQATFYNPDLGACGIVNTDNDHIVAVSHLLYDTFPGYAGGNPNNNPICGKKVTAHYQGKSTTVTITDRCVGCAMFDLDFAPAAFNDLALPAVGRLDGMTWTFV